MAMLLLGHLHIFLIAQWMFSDHGPYFASYQCSPNYHGFDFNLAFRWLYFHQVPSVNNDNSTFPTFEFVRQSYISVTIWLSNKECLKLLLLSISSSRQCNGNVMVNLTQNGQWALSSPPLPLLLSKLLEMRRRFKFDWHKNNSVSSCLQSGEKQSSLLRFPKKSKEKSPLISMSPKVEYPRCLAWLNAKGALMITFAQSWLGFEGRGQARVRV